MRLKLKEMLEDRGVTAYRLAKAVGVSQPSVSAWIHGRKRAGETTTVFPDYESLERVCRYLDCTPNDLLEMDQPPPAKTYRDEG